MEIQLKFRLQVTGVKNHPEAKALKAQSNNLIYMQPSRIWCIIRYLLFQLIPPDWVKNIS